MTNKASIKGRAEQIKEKYRFDAGKLWDLPVDYVNKYGYPFSFEKRPEGYYIVFQQWPSCFARLLLVALDFKVVTPVLELPYMFDFCFNPGGTSIYVTEIDLFNFYAGDNKKALANPNNRVAKYNRQGELEQVLYRPSGEEFFPKGLCRGIGEELVFYDYAGTKVWRIDTNGNPNGSIGTGKLFVRKLKVAPNGDIYYISTSRVGRIRIGDEAPETLWKISTGGDITQLYANRYSDIKHSNIFDFEVLGDGSLFVLQSQGIVKLDASGKQVYTIAMSDRRWEDQGTDGLHFLSISKDKRTENIYYVLIAKKREQTYHLYRLEI